MSCLSPLIRIEEDSYFYSLFYRPMRERFLHKKPYRGGVFFPFDSIISCYEREEKDKSFRDFFLNRKEVSIIPCGNCLSCQLKYSRDWSIRTYLESEKTREDRFNYFVTLTYDDNFIHKKDFVIPTTGEVINLNILVKEDIQKFIKRLRKKYGEEIKYFLCGEYGSKTYRPHYHLILLNMPDIIDREFLSCSGGNIFFTSPTFSKLWEFGFHSISECSINTIFYTSHYCLKKSGKSKINLKSLEDDIPFQNEFQLMSRRPGLGEDFFKSRIYNENKNYTENHCKIKDIDFQVSSIKYYNYLYDKFDLWSPIKERKKPLLLDVYNNSYLTLQEEEAFKQKLKYNETNLLRSSF